jgi:hypothetical protein
LDIVAVILLQKNVVGLEQPISFFSRALRDAEVKYDIMEKQTYALVKLLSLGYEIKRRTRKKRKNVNFTEDIVTATGSK